MSGELTCPPKRAKWSRSSSENDSRAAVSMISCCGLQNCNRTRFCWRKHDYRNRYSKLQETSAPGSEGEDRLRSIKARPAGRQYRTTAAILLSVFAASCTSIADPDISAGMPGYNSVGMETAAVVHSDEAATTGSTALSLAYSGPQELMSSEGDTVLPDHVAYVPTANPAFAPANNAPTAPAEAAIVAGATPEALPGTGETGEVAEAASGDEPAVKPADVTALPTQKPTEEPVVTTAEEVKPQELAPKKKGFLAALFGSSSTTKAKPAVKETPKPLISQEKAKPIIASATAEGSAKPLALASVGDGEGWSGEALPGVRKTALFEIRRRSGLDDDSDIDINEDEGFGTFQVASAAGLARMAPNGLLTQTESVDVACLKPALVRMLKIIESRYGKKVVVTSGYRDPSRNRRARGARNSLHMYCAAADIQVPGVSKWDLANFVRSMPGRGGVGTYCHTESVHVDVGPERDWNWRCRRRK